MRARIFALAFATVAAAAVLAGASACPKTTADPAVARGYKAYSGTCIACHNMNPALDGAVGPAIKGSSKELLRARLLKAEYPPGYKPKRDTHVMPPQPAMEPAIDDLFAFLNQP